ncbi:double-strand break repair protein AddB [Kordiimonas aquimaris]|uniref:double-strand break repair protein AddB n=1 Tax=Kordiimonas aquimaris TaxID=707591 RepID=UPI0021CE4CC5|nr:double-strand break repair protein AddB [Kordiimonas aquimaris]
MNQDVTRKHLPNVYTIGAGNSFVDALVAGIDERFGGDPLALSSATVLLPNRRAVRSLKEAFLRFHDKKPILLPVIRAIGDVDEGEIAFLGAGFGVDFSEIVPAITPVRRQVLLTKLVSSWYVQREKTGTSSQAIAPAQAWRLAGDLAHLIDQVETEGLSFTRLNELAPDKLAMHWNDTLEFLKIVTEHWPQILAEEKVQNPASYRNQLINQATQVYANKGRSGVVIAAGSTGSIPATAHLLRTIARLPNGHVVLPGLETTMSDEIWDMIDDTHPQSGLKRFLDNIGASRYEVAPWLEEGTAEKDTRINLLEQSLLPAAATAQWQSLVATDYSAEGVQSHFDGMSAIVAPTRREEAEAIAVLMREALETPGKTAALVTPDRQLALYVRAALKRWGVAIDDSGGDKAINSLPGRLLTLLAQAVSEHFSPIALLSLLQHPLVSCGLPREAFLPFVRRLDENLLRGVRPASGLDGLIARAQSINADNTQKLSSEDLKTLTQIIGLLRPLERILGSAAVLPAVLEQHVAVAEKLAASSNTSGADVLWRGDAGAGLADQITNLIENTAVFDGISAYGYSTLFAELMNDITVRPSWNQHPRLAIWGPLEARLQQADIMVLGGLNEGVWPAEPDIDPWMSQSMRSEFGLPSLARRIGQSAHDFMLAASAPRVLLTRSLKVDGTPSVPSRWWFRLEALAGQNVPRADQYLGWAAQLSKPDVFAPCSPPAPKPPLDVRPTKLSVTQVQEWMRDPYALYAKKILGLRTIDPIDDRPNAATKGNLLHEALEVFLKEDGPLYGPDGHKRLIETGVRVFEPVLSQPTVYAFWWPRFERIAAWFVKHEDDRRRTHRIVLIEDWAEHSFNKDALSFTLVAKADRIDQHLETEALSIIDYKTGGIPTAKQVEAGYAPQLPLEGLLAQSGAFNGLPSGTVNDLSFWKLSGGDPVCEIKQPIKDVEMSIADAEEGLMHLVQAFADQNTPYLSNPRPSIAGYGEYDHLARVKEWRSGVDPFADAEGDVP